MSKLFNQTPKVRVSLDFFDDLKEALKEFCKSKCSEGDIEKFQESIKSIDKEFFKSEFFKSNENISQLVAASCVEAIISNKEQTSIVDNILQNICNTFADIKIKNWLLEKGDLLTKVKAGVKKKIEEKKEKLQENIKVNASQIGKLNEQRRDIVDGAISGIDQLLRRPRPDGYKPSLLSRQLPRKKDLEDIFSKPNPESQSDIAASNKSIGANRAQRQAPQVAASSRRAELPKQQLISSQSTSSQKYTIPNSSRRTFVDEQASDDQQKKPSASSRSMATKIAPAPTPTTSITTPSPRNQVWAAVEEDFISERGKESERSKESEPDIIAAASSKKNAVTNKVSQKGNSTKETPKKTGILKRVGLALFNAITLKTLRNKIQKRGGVVSITNDDGEEDSNKKPEKNSYKSKKNIADKSDDLLFEAEKAQNNLKKSLFQTNEQVRNLSIIDDVLAQQLGANFEVDEKDLEKELDEEFQLPQSNPSNIRKSATTVSARPQHQK